MEIHILEEQTKGVAQAKINGQIAGEMTFSIPENGDFIIIDHTEVEPQFKGQGVGKTILDKVVAMAREKKIKILPLCPFAKAMFQRNADLHDVLK